MKKALILPTLFIIFIISFVIYNQGDTPIETFTQPEPQEKITTDITESTTTTSSLVESISTTTVSEKYEELTFPNNNLDTSEWATYHDDEFGFEVKYPKGWGMVFNDKKNNTPYGTVGDGFSESGVGAELHIFPDNIRSSETGIEVFSIYKGNLTDWVNKTKNNEILAVDIEIRYIKIGNLLGIEIGSFNTPDFLIHEKYVISNNNNLTYVFPILNDPNSKQYLLQLQKILLSFKLTK